jgi:hypothetical protein
MWAERCVATNFRCVTTSYQNKKTPRLVQLDCRRALVNFISIIFFDDCARMSGCPMHPLADGSVAVVASAQVVGIVAEALLGEYKMVARTVTEIHVDALHQTLDSLKASVDSTVLH